MNNLYFEKARKLLQLAEKNIKDDINSMSLDEMITPVLFFALGMESLFKGIIYKVNVLFTYKNTDFKSIAPIVYKQQYQHPYKEPKRDENDSSKDKIRGENSMATDVLTFGESLLRAKCFSTVSYKNKATLFRLKNIRDDIAHKTLDLLEEQKLKDILGQFRYLIFKYEEELAEKFISAIPRPTELSERDLELETHISDLVALHKNKWKEQKQWEEQKQEESLKKAREETFNRLQDYDINGADGAYTIRCPACSNEAVIWFQVGGWVEEFNGFGYETVPATTSLVLLNCCFCGFRIDKTEELDWFDKYRSSR